MKKYRKLLAVLAESGGAMVAFSGGVDSTLLLHAAREALGDRVAAATVVAPYIPEWEIAEAREYAASMGVEHDVIEVGFPEELRMNPPDHCCLCKKRVFGRIRDTARSRELSDVFDGTNADDLNDWRPGMKALEELGIRSPLLEAGLGKGDIRELSREFGLPTWDKPAYACLLSRMPVDVEVREEDLRRVEAAEVFLMGIGFRAVRVRHHGEVARIEVPRDRLGEFLEESSSNEVPRRLKELGYRHVALDLDGYVMGSLNRIPEE